MKIIAVLFAVCVFFSATQQVAAQNCALCEYVIGAVENWVEQNSTVSEIEQYLQQLCSFVPAFGQVCDQIADEGVDAIVSYLQNNENPQQVCTQIGACSSVAVQGGGECSVCGTVVNTMETWIASSSTEAQIESYLDTLCGLVPGFGATCDAIIAAGIPTVINWIQTNENSTVVCIQLGLCTATQVVKPKLGDECSNCQTLIGTMEHWLAENQTESWIENELITVVCKLVPSFGKTCSAIFDNGIPETVNWIELYENPQVVCTQLGLCTAASSSFKIVKPVNKGKISMKLVQIN